MTEPLHQKFMQAARRPWRRAPFDAWQASRTPEERAQEAAALAELFALMEKSPTAAGALAWARAHDVVFVVAKEKPRVGAYMMPGAGVVVLNALLFTQVQKDALLINSFTHETRHVWQDYHRLLPAPITGEGVARLGLRQSMLRTALCEADAEAHGALAAWELHNPNADRQHRQRLMQQYFLAWDKQKTPYASATVARHAIVWRLENPGAATVKTTVPEVNALLMALAASDRMAQNGIDPDRREQLEQLGRSFACGNYLAALKVGNLPRIFTDMGAKLADHAVHCPQDAPLMTAIRKYEMRWRRRAYPLARAPLPKDLKKGQ